MNKEKKYRDLIFQIIKLYRKARKVKFNNQKISRGRSHSVSSIVEDLFAKFLVENIKCDKIFIDQPISIDGLSNTSYPDLLITKGNIIIGTCDLKMDMGWNRDGIYDLCNKSFDLVKKIRSKNCKIRSGTDKSIINFKISGKCFHNIIIISGENNNKVKLEKQRKESLKFSPLVNVFVLTSGKHLNTYNIKDRKLLDMINIDINEFNRLLETFTLL